MSQFSIESTLGFCINLDGNVRYFIIAFNHYYTDLINCFFHNRQIINSAHFLQFSIHTAANKSDGAIPFFPQTKIVYKKKSRRQFGRERIMVMSPFPQNETVLELVMVNYCVASGIQWIAVDTVWCASSTQLYGDGSPGVPLCCTLLQSFQSLESAPDAQSCSLTLQRC